MKTIKVDKVILYYMDRVDPDGNLYRFYMYKGMASEIEYFCTKEAGNMTIPIGEGKYVKIVPKEIERIPVRGYRKLAGEQQLSFNRSMLRPRYFRSDYPILQDMEQLSGRFFLAGFDETML